MNETKTCTIPADTHECKKQNLDQRGNHGRSATVDAQTHTRAPKKSEILSSAKIMEDPPWMTHKHTRALNNATLVDFASFFFFLLIRLGKSRTNKQERDKMRNPPRLTHTHTRRGRSAKRSEIFCCNSFLFVLKRTD